MFRIDIPTVIDFEAISKNFIKANEAAITAAAAAAVTPLRAMQPVRTGKLASEVGVKFFKQRNRLRGASLKVIGDRSFVAQILEFGTRDGRIKARHTFERAEQLLGSVIESRYTQTFFETLEKLSAK